jgi:5,5'-dehydrodivanillate O-demethylase oxygenase subunit
MLTQAENETLTRVGAGTPMGDLLRRYWQPIAAAAEMRDRWTKRLRLFGEDLVLYRDRSGKLGLIAEFCPHRHASFANSIPVEDGIRCSYHGWKFDASGQCTELPNEPAGSTFKDKVRTAAYPVQELGGLLFAYLGPLPAPLLPRFDAYIEPRAIRMLGRALVPCNWLQIMENSVDPVHTEWLHGKFYEFVRENAGERVAISAHHLKIGFEEFEFGMYKRRLLEGQSEDSDDWRVGHPILFPNVLAVGGADETTRRHAFQIRVPIDDTHTMHYWYDVYVPPAGAEVPPHLLDEVFVYDVPFKRADGEWMVEMLDAQDIMSWVAQGDIADRSIETLASADRGVTLYRRMLQRELKRVAGGEDPMGTLRDPARNERIDIPLERGKHHFSDGFERILRKNHMQFSPIAEDLVKLFTAPAKALAGAAAGA